MRLLKLCTILGVLAALVVPAAPSWAVTLPPLPASPFKIIVGAYDMGALYPTIPAGGTVTGSAALDAIQVGPAGGVLGEDSWGVGMVNQFQTAHVVSNPPPGVINGGVGSVYWSDGDLLTECVFEFWGASDTVATKNMFGDLTTYSVGLEFAMWAQPVGASDAETTALLGSPSTFADAGSSGRLASGGYVGAGYDVAGAAIVGAVPIITGTGTVGFFTGPGVGNDMVANFNINGLTGFAISYLSVGGVTLPGGTPLLGVQNSGYDTNFFNNGAGVTADLLLNLTTNALTNPPIFTNDFLVSANGPVAGHAVPEPMTMLGLMLGVGGLAGYIRKRRTA